MPHGIDAQRLCDHAAWLRARAGETEMDLYRWLMEGLAEELEERAHGELPTCCGALNCDS